MEGRNRCIRVSISKEKLNVSTESNKRNPVIGLYVKNS
jgi:hypothetical protein